MKKKTMLKLVCSLGLLAMVVAVAATLWSAPTALAANPNLPPGCVPCGTEFKGPNAEPCGIAEEPVLSYRANGGLIGLYSNRCFGCTATGAFCTVGQSS